MSMFYEKLQHLKHLCRGKTTRHSEGGILLLVARNDLPGKTYVRIDVDVPKMQWIHVNHVIQGSHSL